MARKRLPLMAWMQHIAHLFKTLSDLGHAAALHRQSHRASGVILISAGEDSQTPVALKSAKEWRESKHHSSESSFNRKPIENVKIHV
jgi:hypothetical protein